MPSAKVGKRGASKNAMLTEMGKYDGKLRTIVLFLILFLGIAFCFLWWGMLVFLVITGVRLFLRR